MSGIPMPQKFVPIYVFNINEDALTETILNFRNVQVVLDKKNVIIRARQPKSSQRYAGGAQE